MNAYQVLSVDRRARLADIKKSYRKLARRYHPDLNPGDTRSESRFKEISEAYEILSDPQKRKAHDLQLEYGDARSSAGSARGEVREHEGAFDFGDVGGFSSFFSEILGGRPSESFDRDAPKRGEDLTHALNLTFFDAMRGLTSQMTLDAESACPRCNGSGKVPSRHRRPCNECAGTGRISRATGVLRFFTPCPRCDGGGMLGGDGCGNCGGTGVLRRRETLKVHIPAGVDSGSRVRVPGKGRAGRNGGPPGDLFIITQVEPHPYFRRIGDNIYCAVPITVTEAALGTRIEVPTIDGKAMMRVLPGTENGQKLRLRGKGVPSLRDSARGDHYVEVRVTTPRAADERSRQILQELGDLNSGDELRRALFA
jgi:molecular chaperone DnaJ